MYTGFQCELEGRSLQFPDSVILSGVLGGGGAQPNRRGKISCPTTPSTASQGVFATVSKQRVPTLAHCSRSAGILIVAEILPRRIGSLCGLGFDGFKLAAQLFSLPFEFCFEPFFPLGISCVPDGLVVFDLVFDHGVKDHCDLVGGCHGGSFGAELGFHSAQVVA
jgi:hypothetical protein